MLVVILLAFACLFFAIDLAARRFWMAPNPAAPGPYYTSPWVSVGLLCMAAAMLKYAVSLLR
jgi:hypothetical protein